MSLVRPAKRSLSLGFLTFFFLSFTVASVFGAKTEKEPGLLFYLSGDNGFTADFAKGNPEPTMLNDVTIVKDGAKGSAFSQSQFHPAFRLRVSRKHVRRAGNIFVLLAAARSGGKDPVPHRAGRIHRRLRYPVQLDAHRL